jgi:hypothetical protein
LNSRYGILALLNDAAKDFSNPIFAFAIRAGSAKDLASAHVGHAKTHKWWRIELLWIPLWYGRGCGTRRWGYAIGWQAVPLGTELILGLT